MPGSTSLNERCVRLCRLSRVPTLVANTRAYGSVTAQLALDSFIVRMAVIIAVPVHRRAPQRLS
jgi:hypothetical protein